MKTILTLILLGTGFLLTAQSIDYNTKKGYVAEGYDVVAYFNNTAEKGKTKTDTSFDSVKYKFASDADLEKFKADPEKYIPQYGGYCAYAMATSGEKVSIDPETYEIRDGKLYLFYNSWGNNTLELWKKESPQDLIEKADKNWELVKNKK